MINMPGRPETLCLDAELVQRRQSQEAGRLSDARLQPGQAQGCSLQERLHPVGTAPL